MKIYLHPLCTFLDLNKEQKQLWWHHRWRVTTCLQVFWEKAGKFLSPQALSTYPRGLWSSGQGHLSSRLEKPSYPLSNPGLWKGRGGGWEDLHTEGFNNPLRTHIKEKAKSEPGGCCGPVLHHFPRIGEEQQLRSMVTIPLRDRFTDTCSIPHLCLLILFIHLSCVKNFFHISKVWLKRGPCCGRAEDSKREDTEGSEHLGSGSWPSRTPDQWSA